ncbi:hypothetical protein [Glycomyces buryatensis]|uniref:Uncharacterized protein n=1 Tax=Glycomyces buryatensis TaxID=2570927 RepID=A0A4V4HSY2_9ACTN|nr:hypothetical protein [Glycomyces buryatensis]THV43456.1 hypothetical protein FAB82_00935 [Glycomyces buryatensis]
MTQTRESRPSATNTGAAEKQVGETTTSVTRADSRRILKVARRALGAALAQADPHPDLIAAAGLVIEAGGRRG